MLLTTQNGLGRSIELYPSPRVLHIVRVLGVSLICCYSVSLALPVPRGETFLAFVTFPDNDRDSVPFIHLFFSLCCPHRLSRLVAVHVPRNASG